MHVFVLALGPVQPLIAASRRTRDLWFGSWLLSELARAVGKALAEEHGPARLIFPASQRLADPDATFVNKIVARIQGSPARAGELCAGAVRGRLHALRDEAFAGIRADEDFQFALAEAQIDDLIELQWAAAPEGSEGYRAARSVAEGLLGARKGLRLFAPVTWGRPVPKSAIDGLRETVIEDSAHDRRSPSDLYQKFRIDRGERLCGVSLLKRLGRREPGRSAEHHFLSTGHLASGPLRARLLELQRDPEVDRKLALAWKAYRTELEGTGADLSELGRFVHGKELPYTGPFDGSLFYESRLPGLFPEIASAVERQKKARGAAAKLAAFLWTAGVPSPRPYYAVLHADGDRMGAAIDQLQSPEEHVAISEALSDFAREARRLTEEVHEGELVYAGGDDVLALLPVHQALACAEQLDGAFRNALERFPDGTGATPTLSVGVAVAHFLDPLQGAVELSREAERAAKRARDRAGVAARRAGRKPPGGLAIAIDKRSGPPLEVAGVWGDLEKDLKTFVAWHRAEDLPDRAAFDLRALAGLLEGAEVRERVALEEMARLEALRLLGQKKGRRGTAKTLGPEVLEPLAERILAGGSIAELADRLLAARLFAQAELESVPARRTKEGE